MGEEGRFGGTLGEERHNKHPARGVNHPDGAGGSGRCRALRRPVDNSSLFAPDGASREAALLSW